jgi:hypothetical protein
MAACSTVSLLLFAASLGAPDLVTSALLDILAIAAAIACFKTARQAGSLTDVPLRGSFRRSWWLFAAAAVAWSSELLYFSLIVVSRQLQWRLSLWFLMLLSYSLLLIASLVLPVGHGSRYWLDGLVSGASFTAILVVSLFLLDYNEGWVPELRGSSGVLLPFVLLSCAASSLLLRVRSPNTAPTVLLGVALSLLALDQLNLLRLGPDHSAELVGWLLILFATFRPIRASSKPVSHLWATVTALLPTGLFIAALVALLLGWFLFPRDGPVVAAYGLGLIVLQIVRRLFTPSTTPPEEATQVPTAHKHWLKSRSPDVILSALGLVTIWLLYQTLLVSPRPSTDHQGIAFAVRGMVPKPTDGFRIDVHMGVPKGPFGCHNPVSVTAIITGTPKLWEQHAHTLNGKVHFGVGIYSGAGGMKLVTAEVGGNPMAPIKPSQPTQLLTQGNGIGAGLSQPKVRDDPDGSVSTIPGWINRWSSNLAPIVVSFEANWVARRNLGSCYVRLPSLTGNSDDGASNALLAAIAGAEGEPELRPTMKSGWSSDEKDVESVKSRVAASHGRIRLTVDAFVLGDQSSPRAERYNAAQSETIWTCSSSRLDTLDRQAFTHPRSTYKGLVVPTDEPLPGDSSCGGFAVVTTPMYEPFNALALILIGVVVSIWVEIAYKESSGV